MNENVRKELELSVKYFLETYSHKKCSFGIVPDSYPGKYSYIASIAASGFFFSSLVIASEYGYLKKEKAEKIFLKSLNVIKDLDSLHGWFSHFYDMRTGERLFGTEYSTIDTCLMLAGALTAGSYFGGEGLKIAKSLLNRCNFQYVLKEFGHMFSMSINYDRSFAGHWDRYAEQLIMYVLGAANTRKDHKMPSEIYYKFIRDRGEYAGHKFIYSWHNALFTHQYSQAYVDFRGLVDKNGDDWFENSVQASLASQKYAESLAKEYKSINGKSWGLTACATKENYSGRFGSLPVGDYQVFHDGTMAPCGAIGSIVFTPKESLEALEYYYQDKNLLGKFGLYDSYNLDKNWYCPYYIAIDKGITAVMLANYFDGIIWKYFNKLDIIQESLKELGFAKKGE